ncbi:carbohydrate ABC transporter permease [Herbinix luporum]|uniref:carbohydrate ABC transporter permease n=1 Tax=Herbinix luporum TaxID=1679721 RepID=UPI0017797C68|nr:sugar ABC transporter permease [Herbinix luporum]HHT57443.1 sugar ABC transporter permease [Herbinix luporum]
MINDRKVNKLGRRNNWAYLFVAPFIITFLIFSVYPVFRTLYLSFTNYKGFGTPNFVGVDNYERVVGDKFFWRAFGNTIKIWGFNIVLQLGTALLLTIVFNDIKYKIKGLGFFRAVFYLPNIIATTSVAFLFKTLFDWRYGTVNQLLAAMGISENSPINWTGNSAIAPYFVGGIGAWMWFGNSFILLMAGVQGISKDYFEAAAIDGAGRWKIFSKITIPLLRPILLYVGITSLIGGLQMFDIPFLISGGTHGNPSGSLQTVIMYLYKFGFEVGTNQVGYAAAIAYSLFAIILVISIVQYKLMREKEDY